MTIHQPVSHMSKIETVGAWVTFIIAIVGGTVAVFNYFTRYVTTGEMGDIVSKVHAMELRINEHETRIEVQQELMRRVEEDLHWHNEAEYRILQRDSPNTQPPPRHVRKRGIDYEQ